MPSSIRGMLNRFGETRMELNEEYPDARFKVVETRNTLPEEDWLDEIHPTGEGFRKIADRIYAEGIKPVITG